MNESASVMASQLSSVSTEASAADQIDISSPLNSILKLADYMQQNCTMPSYLTFLFFIWLMYQILMTAFWHAFTSKEIHPKIYYSTLLSSKNMYFIENNSNYNPITFSQRNPFYQNIITKMRQWIQKIPIIGKFSVMHNYTSNSNKLNHVNVNPNNQLNFSQKSIKILDDDDHGHDHEGGEVIDGGYCNMLFYTLYKIAFFSETFDKIDDFPIIFIIFSIIFAVSIISLFFAFIRFRMTRQMDKYSVYIVRFLHEFVGLILVHPIASIIGQMCAMLLNDDFFLYFNSHSVIIDADSEDTPVEFFGSGLSSMSYITLTLLFVYLIYFMVWSSFGIGITSASGYIEDSFLMCFDQFPLRAFIIFNALVLLFQPIFIFIGQWAVLSLLIFHCLISIVIFTRFLYIPFYSMFSNIVCNSVIIASFLLDTLVALIYFHAIPKDKGSQYIFLTVFLLALLTSIGLFIYFKRVKIRELFFNRKKNTANGRKHLIDDLNKPSNEELFERLIA
ncbi:hypothetical protein TRFO_03697 [Tritrichomonas foetus]|uniref:Transmembrane protein n=1 Tax=Tritrichomonas foetus TaxID=1144522 RepID=A0A1J4KLS4_9EUKA|nr:hypothetical protein TRFO_03697 [Tritrichomonas foetus]|eukprot:OHT12082.1 hypothetical protein TRFO_03697 [Tritrichomonas foetus]